MFSFIVRNILLTLSIYGNIKWVIDNIFKISEFKILNYQGKIFTLVFNYITIFSLSLGFLKNIKFFKILHSFFMTISLSLEFLILIIYFFIKYKFPKMLENIKSGDKNFDLLIELSQNVFLFLACLMDPLKLIRAKFLISFVLFLLSFMYILIICYLHKYYNIWIYEFLKLYDNVEVWFFFLFIIILPQIFYGFLLIFMPNHYYTVKNSKKKLKEKKE